MEIGNGKDKGLPDDIRQIPIGLGLPRQLRVQSATEFDRHLALEQLLDLFRPTHLRRAFRRPRQRLAVGQDPNGHRLDKRALSVPAHHKVRRGFGPLDEEPLLDEEGVQIEFPGTGIETCALELLDEIAIDVDRKFFIISESMPMAGVSSDACPSA